MASVNSRQFSGRTGAEAMRWRENEADDQEVSLPTGRCRLTFNFNFLPANRSTGSVRLRPASTAPSRDIMPPISGHECIPAGFNPMAKCPDVDLGNNRV